MNIIFKNDTIYKYESFWRHSVDDNTRDSNGNLFPIPKEGKHWTDSENFVSKLQFTEEYLKNINRYFPYEEPMDCLLCDQKKVSNGKFNFNKIIWDDSLAHYINVHNVKSSEEFIDAIYNFNPNPKYNKRTIKFRSSIYEIDDIKYVKLDRNQIMIMDALMKHGGYSKKYIDTKNKNVYRYSEHAGLLDFGASGLDKIIISGNTTRVDRGDEEIYLPKNMYDALSYEYIFHTHPPTPKPGGRARNGIVYEIPSISDLFHFIDHFNSGLTQGSIVIASEGLYNIRKLEFDRVKIKISDEEKMFQELQQIYSKVQKDAIKKYGTEFSTYDFYSKIAQDPICINDLNSVLNKYKLQIDFYPRIKDNRGKWIIDSLHLPVYITSKQS
jgi:hypothetical protein